jgi:glycerol-3-phosphate acyltransferase PlsY
LIGYVIGCFQTSFFVGKLNKIDIRNYGSKNAGATNVKRVLGLKAGIIVFIIDILKSIIAFMICSSLFKSRLAGVYSGIGVVLGHDFPFYLKFKGGKGIASSMGLILIFDWRAAIIAYTIGILVVIFSRKISAGSIIASFLLPFILILLNYSKKIVFLFSFIVIINIIKHWQNIKRLLSGKEENFF